MGLDEERGREISSKQKKLSLAEYILKGLSAVATTFYRFPLAVFLLAVIATLAIYMVRMPYNNEIFKVLERIIAVAALGVLFTLSYDLFIEKLKRKSNVFVRLGYYAIQLLILWWYFASLFTEFNQVTTMRHLFISIAMGLVFLTIPYLPSKENFEVYISKIMTGAVTTIFFTVVLGAGVSAILFAIKSLIFSEMDYKYYAYTWILAASIFAPMYFLHGLPQMHEVFDKEHFNKVLKAALLYIVMPVMTVYTAVLYIYFAKIIITQEWPSGIVSYLVVSYAAVATVTIFLVTPFKNDNKWVKSFISVFTKLIFPLLLMMFISIGIRIGEFGFTENRYIIVIIGIWATLAMIFLNINKGKNNTVLPISLAIFALVTVSGPWSAFNVSKISQANRFYNILSKYNMIENGKVVNNNSNIDIIDKREVSGILDYFSWSHNLTDLQYLPEDFSMDKMEEVFGFERVYAYSTSDSPYFGYSNVASDEPIKITDYDVFFELNAYKIDNENRLKFEQEFVDEEGSIRLRVDENNVLMILRNNIDIYRYDITDYVEFLYEKYGGSVRTTDVSNEDFVVIAETNDIKMMLVFRDIFGQKDAEKDLLELNGLHADVYVQIK